MKINDNGTIKDLVVKASDTLPIGSIIPFGGTEAPTNWLICDGSMLNRAAYPELFNAIGTSFGTDGPGNFYIPDLRGRVIVGQDTSDADFGIGLTGGEKTHKLTVDEMPSHRHNGGEFINTNNPDYWSGSSVGSGGGIAGFLGTGHTPLTSEGGNQPHNNLQPYTVTNYIIKAKQSIGVVGNVVNEKSTSAKDTYSCDYINGVQGTVLYNGGHTLETVTLSDDISNYSYIEVIGRGADVGSVSSGKIPVTDYLLINLVGTSFRDEGSTLCYWVSTLLAEGNTLTPQSSNWAYLSNSGSGIGSGNFMGVVKVIGYK